MTKYLGIVLDEDRMSKIRGTPLEGKVSPIFGGALKLITIEVSDEMGREILDQFSRARFDARGYIEEVPIAFKKAVFRQVIETKSLGEEPVKMVLSEEIGKIKEESAKEDKELPVPDVDISDILKLQEKPVQKPA